RVSASSRTSTLFPSTTLFRSRQGRRGDAEPRGRGEERHGEERRGGTTVTDFFFPGRPFAPSPLRVRIPASLLPASLLPLRLLPQIGRAHVCTPVTDPYRMPPS